MGDHHHLQQQQGMNGGGGGLDLPPGFRFHPTDEEIITFYLAPKVLDRSFCATAIGEVDLNKSEPWDLPGKAKMGEKEWYFYCQKDRKYPTGMRTNRATEAGYWKATGKDKEIYRPAKPTVLLVGMKKTLVFYKGRAPRGEKTNWVMHEYRLDGRLPYPATNSINRSSKDEWVVCRIFHKSSGIKKVMPSYASCMAMNNQIRGIPMSMSMHMPIPIPMPAMGEQGFTACALPPLMDPSSLVAPPPPASSSCLAGLSLGNAALPVNGHYFDNHHMGTAKPQQPAMFYQQQMQMEETAGFMAAPASGPSSMVSQDTGVSNEQNNSAAAAAAEISSVDMGMDGMWKY